MPTNENNSSKKESKRETPCCRKKRRRTKRMKKVQQGFPNLTGSKSGQNENVKEGSNQGTRLIKKQVKEKNWG